jgi:hypothetical protein
MSSGDGNPKNALFHELFVTSDTLFRLLKAVNQSPNTSLAFCIYDLCAEILARLVFPYQSSDDVVSVNHKIGGLEKLLSDVNHATSNEGEENNELIGLAHFAQKELREASTYYAAFTSNMSSSNPLSSTGGATTVSIEYRLLRSLSSRLMTESGHYRQHSKLTQVTCQLLLQILNLRRSLTGISPYNANLHMEIIEDWVSVKSVLTGTTTPTSSGKLSDHENEKSHKTSLNITQISPNSITVAWSGIPESDEFVPPSGPKSTSSQRRIAASVGGLLASIKGSAPLSPHTSYSLYITPLSGSQQTLPLEQRSRTLLVLPYVSTTGSQKIDLLDPGESMLGPTD